MRLDVALFELRLFKSRSQAGAAIEDGSVHVNGARAKPSKNLHPGDRITLFGPSGSRALEVVDLPRRSLSKEEARELLREVPQEERGPERE